MGGGKTSKKRAGAVRHAKSEFLARKRAAANPRFWHGGAPGLQVGEELLSRNDAIAAGIPVKPYDLQVGYALGITDPDRVYFTTDREGARGFAALMEFREPVTGVVHRHGSLYEVEPLSVPELDPDNKSGAALSAPRARIVDVVEDSVDLTPYEVTERLGPAMTWQDDSPVYSPEGAYLPSPEQVQGNPGRVLAKLRNAWPWTPLDFLNAWLEGRPSGGRPDPTSCPGIMTGAKESLDVRLDTAERARTLMAEGVEFVFGIGNAAEANALFAQLGLTPRIEDGDPRALCVAKDSHGTVIGALVYTAFEVQGRFAMMLDAVGIHPEWQRRGVGSVLLVSGQELIPAPPVFAAGHCDPDVSDFFAQLGFTVLHPGQDLLIPLGDSSQGYAGREDQVWFYRQGPI